MVTFQSLVDRLLPRSHTTLQSLDATRQYHQHSGRAAAFRQFLEQYPSYATTSSIDRLRASQYTRLDRAGHTYLDYTGGSLYAESQLQDHMQLLHGHVFGNPHSKNLTSMAMTSLVEQARAAVLRYFNASPKEYTAIFTPNATGALRLVGEAYPFTANSTYMLTADNHNSVNGIREFARRRGAAVRYLPISAPALRVDPHAIGNALGQATPGMNNLLAYPAQSNFSGVQHPLEWIEQAQQCGWDVLLDAAAFVPTNRLDLQRWKPDFVDLSFYKMFGYPTGIGCLLVRTQALRKLCRPWYAGGTISFSSVAANGHYLTPGAAGFEDGTVNYLAIPAIERGLQLIESIGIDTIHARVSCLTAWLLGQLTTLRHSNRQPVVQLYGPANMTQRGATVQVNFLDRNGSMFDCYQVEQEANRQLISLRAGCHCNPGGREAALGFTQADLDVCFRNKEQMSFEQFVQTIDGKTTGAVRASLGLVSNFADVYAYVQFAQTFVDR